MSNILLPQIKISENAASLDKFNWEKGAFYNYLKYTNLFVNTFEEIKPIFIKCYDQDCLERVIFECKCSDEKIFICKTHAIIHLTEHGSKIHNLKTIDTEIDTQKLDELHDYLKNYNSDLENLKQVIVTKVTDHFKKINRDMILLFENIDARISKNKQAISEMFYDDQKNIENKESFENFLKPIFQKKCEIIDISDECLDIFEHEIKAWNASKTNKVISNAQNKDKITRKLFQIQNKEKSLEMVSNLEKWTEESKKPLLHWLDRNEVHFFDHIEKVRKSIRIDGLNRSDDIRSISIDFDNIILFGQERTQKNREWLDEPVVYKFTLSKKSTKKFAPMNTFRKDFCMTLLDGFCYALGGSSDNKTTIKLCERFSLGDNKWENISDLNEPRTGGSCVSIPENKSIYIFGGKNHDGKLHWLIEKYDAILCKNWTTIQFVTISGYKLGSCLLPGTKLILIYGGANDRSERQEDCYFYNYEANQFSCANSINGDLIEVINQKKYNRYVSHQYYCQGEVFPPVILDNKLFCYNLWENTHDQISIYDIESGVWSLNIKFTI